MDDSLPTLRTFIRQMGGNLRTSHVMKIYVDGFSNKDRPIDHKLVRDNYNKDRGRSSLLYRNTKFKENPLKSYYPPEVVKRETKSENKQYNPKLIDYIINPSRENYQVAGLQSTRSSLNLSMLRHTNRLGRFDNRVLRQGTYRPVTTRNQIIRVINDRYFRMSQARHRAQLKVESRHIKPFQSLGDFCQAMREELISAQQEGSEIDLKIFKFCLVALLKKRTDLTWVGPSLYHPRPILPRAKLDKVIENDLESVEDDSLKIKSPPKREPSRETTNLIQSELSQLKGHVNQDHLKLVEQLLIEVRQLMSVNNVDNSDHGFEKLDLSQKNDADFKNEKETDQQERIGEIVALTSQLADDVIEKNLSARLDPERKSIEKEGPTDASTDGEVAEKGESPLAPIAVKGEPMATSMEEPNGATELARMLEEEPIDVLLRDKETKPEVQESDCLETASRVTEASKTSKTRAKLTRKKKSGTPNS
jgi:hypothetical protein